MGLPRKEGKPTGIPRRRLMQVSEWSRSEAAEGGAVRGSRGRNRGTRRMNSSPLGVAQRLSVLLLSACCIALCPIVRARGADGSQSLPLDPGLGIITLPLWNTLSGPKAGSAGRAASTLTAFLPQPGTGVGTAVIIAPGGAYLGLAMNLEGRQVADWFAARGIVAFVLKYRLGARHPFPQSLHDAQRAVRLVRSWSNRFGFSPNRIGFAGFSAGGHLAATEATTFDDGNPQARDPVARLSDRPDFLILGYPWLNAMQPNFRGLITYCSVLPATPVRDCKVWERKYTPALHVTSRTPSTFIYATSDDSLVPVQASVEFYSALIAAGVPAELHLFRHGAHGSGLGLGDPALDKWPLLLESWLRGQGWLTPDPAVAAAERARMTAPPRKPGEPLTIHSRIGDILRDPAAEKVVDALCGPGFLEQLPEAAQVISLKTLAAYRPGTLSPKNLGRIGAAFRRLPIR